MQGYSGQGSSVEAQKQASIGVGRPDRTPEAPKLGEVTQYLSILNEKISILHDELAVLENRVQPIMTQPVASESGKVPEKIANGSTIADILKQYNHRLHGMIEMVRSVSQRIDL